MFSEAHSEKLSRWNRKFYNAYWITFAIYSVAKLMNMYLIYVTSPDKLNHFLQYYVILGLSVCLLILAAGELAVYLTNWNTYVNMLFATLLTCAYVVFADYIPGIIMILLFPMLTTVFYYNKRQVVISCVMTIIFIALLGLCFPQLVAHPTDWAGIMATMVCGLFVSLVIINRGDELLSDLKESMVSRQELMIQKALIERDMKMDGLTQLYNHKTFHLHLEQAIQLKIPFQLALIDVDNFKRINDTYGHSAGDIALKRVAETLKTHMRADDMAARYGGEEFALILMESSMQEAVHTLERVRVLISEQTHTELDQQHITVSIGVTRYREGITKEELFQEADHAMYESKKTGKNKIVVQS